MTKKMNKDFQVRNKGVNMRTYSLSDDAVGVIDAQPRGERTKWLEQAIETFQWAHKKHFQMSRTVSSLLEENESLRTRIRELEEGIE